MVRITLSLNQGVELTLVASYGRQIIPRTMSVPGADGHTRRQVAALGFSTPKDSVPQPFSTPVIATLPKKGFIEHFYQAEGRQAEWEQSRAEQEEQRRLEDQHHENLRYERVQQFAVQQQN